MSNRKPKTDQKLKRAVSFAAEGEAVEMDKIKTRKNQEKKEPIRRRPSFYDEPSKIVKKKETTFVGKLSMEIPKAKPIPISLPSNSSQSFHTPLQSFHMFSNSPRREDIYVNRLKDHLVGSQGVHSLLGGAITRDIYLAAEKLESDSRTRRNSEPNITLVEQDVISARELQQPGGFRRNFIHNRNLSLGKPTHFVTNNFMDFLALYGYYGGDVSPEDDEEFQVIDSEANETQPLMGSTHSLRNSSSSVTGTSAQKAFFMIMKAFVGAFANGGLVLSIILLVFIGWLTLHCMILLLESSRAQNGLSMGELAHLFYGKNFRSLVLWSIAISQMGFSCAYFIFIGKNLKDLIEIFSSCYFRPTDWACILVQLIFYIPLSWVRKIKHFSLTSLIGDAFIGIGLIYILYYDAFTLIKSGRIGENIKLFNFQQFPVLVGTLMFAFEGICLILPIGNSMKHPERFQATLTLAIIVTGAIFIIIGSIGYLTFGDKVEILVFLNMESSFVLSSVQMLYVLAIALTFPLAVYPAIRITESSAFGNKTGLKWTKNVYRAFLVSFLAFLSWAANNNLEKVVALVGCLCCIPLSFIYPTMYHIKIVDSKIIIFKDLVIIAFGVLACIYTTYITVKQWGESGAGEVSNRCQ